jgi:murein hydrolase activator
MQIRYFIILIFSFFHLVTWAQSKDNLEKERKKINQEIEKADKTLKQATKSKENVLKVKKELDSKLNTKSKEISSISLEIKSSDSKIKNNNALIDSLSHQLSNLKNQYLQLQRYTYLRSLSNNKWVYLLSSENINILFLRWRYIRQYEDFTKNKKSEILDLQEKIKETNAFIAGVKDGKGKQLAQEQEQINVLKKEQEQSNKKLEALSSQELELKKEIDRKKIVRDKLNIAIERIIFAQLKETREKINIRKQSNNEVDKELNKAEILLSDNFAANKNKFPWPISSGHVSSRFGSQAHPTLKGVVIENNGIDIKSKGGREVKTVYEGEVAGVTKVTGMNYMVIVRHGNYYSVYSNLDKVSVNKGNKIKTQQSIGFINSDDNGISTVHFELWKDKTKLNPESWLR